VRNKLTFLVFFITITFLASAWSQTQDPRTHYVLVSVAPYKFFVEQIAGNTVQVGLMVPAGASAHTYEPTPKEMMKASHADLWFLIGEGFETRASNAIKSHNNNIQLVDLRKGVDLISSDPNHTHHHHQCNHHNCLDLHIWLSPKQSKTQARVIAETLSALYPEHKELYQSNLNKFLNELDNLDAFIATTLKPLKKRLILVSHPAYAYFCRDYDIEQLSIEFEGKDPTPKQLTKVITQARDNGLKTVFIQIQYNNKGARLIANQLGAKVVNLDPYSENYLESMRTIALAIASQ
jgi:zinc transport system substrate-binding protein